MRTYFSDNVRFLIKNRSLKQFDIAKQVGKRQSSISNWVKGVSEPSLSDLVSLNQYFDISIDDLIFTNLSEQGVIKSGKTPLEPTLPAKESKYSPSATQQDFIASQKKIISLLEETVALKDDKIAVLKQDVKNLKQALQGKLNPDLIISRPKHKTSK